MTHPALVDADWLEKHLDDEDVVVVEVDGSAGNYRSGHIRGAVHVDWERDLMQPVVRDLVDRPALEGLLGDRGVRREDTVVVYSGQNNWWAAVMFWCLTLYGHPDVRLLDGGRLKWLYDGRPLVTTPSQRRPTTYRATDVDFGSRALRDDVLQAVGTTTIVDVRSEQEYSGELLAPPGSPQDHPQRGGHVPGAVNVPWTETVRDDGTFRSAEEIEHAYRSRGVDPDAPMIVYCRMGWRSSHSWFALTRLLGARQVRNYDSSWNEYGMLTGVPIER